VAPAPDVARAAELSSRSHVKFRAQPRAPRPRSLYNGCMKACEIFHVPQKKGFRWKWRAILADGRAVESEDTYALYYECVAAAREAGYEPRLQPAAA
jgi:hypothetical protein